MNHTCLVYANTDDTHVLCMSSNYVVCRDWIFNQWPGRAPKPYRLWNGKFHGMTADFFQMEGDNTIYAIVFNDPELYVPSTSWTPTDIVSLQAF